MPACAQAHRLPRYSVPRAARRSSIHRRRRRDADRGQVHPLSSLAKFGRSTGTFKLAKKQSFFLGGGECKFEKKVRDGQVEVGRCSGPPSRLNAAVSLPYLVARLSFSGGHSSVPRVGSETHAKCGLASSSLYACRTGRTSQSGRERREN